MKAKRLGLFLLVLLVSSAFLFAFKIQSVKADPSVSTNLYVNGVVGPTSGITYVGSSPYLDALDYPSNYFYVPYPPAKSTAQSYNFTFADTSSALVVNSVILHFYAKEIKLDGTWGKIYFYTGNQWITLTNSSYFSSWTLFNFNVSAYFSTGAQINNALVAFWMIDPSANSRFYFDVAYLSITGNLPVLSADLEPMDGDGAGWVFVDWRYYTFTATIPSGLYSGAVDQCYLSFNVPTGNGSVLCVPYTNNNGNFSLLSNASGVSADRSLDPVRIADGSITTSTSNTIIAYKIWFTSKCLDVYSETAGVTVGLVWNDTSGVSSSWYYFPNFFRIYNKGGFSLHSTFTGNAGVLPGGRDFSMFAYNNSYAFKDLVWRDLQHVKLLPTVNFRAGAQTFQVYYGMDYVLTDGSWVTGLQARLEVSYVSYTGVFAGNVWINMSCSWYDNNALIKTDNLYMFYHGEVYNYPDPGRWQFWVDLWFDSGNASALQGGRINAYEFPMNDSSAPWFRWLSSNWGVKDELKQSECFVPLHDSDGNPLISTEQIKFVRIYSSLNVVPYTFNQYVAITDFSTFDTTLSSRYPLQGIQTPPWDETKMPTVGSTGLLGAIWSMFAGMGKWLNENVLFGGLSLWPTFVAFLDTIASWLGMPHGFSNMITWLGTGWGWVVSSFTYGITVIYNIFLLLGSILGTLLSVLGSAIVSFVSVISMITGFITGGFSTGASLWGQLGLTTWLTLGIILYPIYLVFLWDAKGMDAVVSQVTMIWGILSWLAHFFMDVVRTIITMLSGIIESVPVVE